MDTKYYEQIPGDMFDFRDFYFLIACRMPDNCVLAEVGVADGKSALYLAGALTELKKKFTLYLIDNMAYGGDDQLNTITNNVIASGLKGIQIVKASSLDAAMKFPDGHFDFVFLDSSHLYKDTKNEIRVWYSNIKEEGILAGHDYGSHKGVTNAVDEVIPSHITRTPIVNRNYNMDDPTDSLFQQVFEEEVFLKVKDTERGHGVWWIEKKFYAVLR